DLPICAPERVSFMSDFAFRRAATHPYAQFSERHRHFKETLFEHLPYSAACVPFRWMLRESIVGDEKSEGLARQYQLGFDPTKEPGLDFETEWIQHKDNQLIMLDTFFSAFQHSRSLCFFYAKKT